MPPENECKSTPWKIVTFDDRCVSRSASLECHQKIEVSKFEIPVLSVDRGMDESDHNNTTRSDKSVRLVGLFYMVVVKLNETSKEVSLI